MKTNFLIILLLSQLLSYGQTKVIAHKSHSGSHSSFAKAYRNNLFDINNSNFGLPDHKVIVVLDTVIALNESVTVLKIRESTIHHLVGTDYKRLKKSDFKFKTDTLIKNSLFNKKNTIQYIKSADRSKRTIRFDNPIDEVVFIGFKK